MATRKYIAEMLLCPLTADLATWQHHPIISSDMNTGTTQGCRVWRASKRFCSMTETLTSRMTELFSSILSRLVSIFFLNTVFQICFQFCSCCMFLFIFFNLSVWAYLTMSCCLSVSPSRGRHQHHSGLTRITSGHQFSIYLMHCDAWICSPSGTWAVPCQAHAVNTQT